MCMNIVLDTQISTSQNSTETVTTTYKPAISSQGTGTVSRSGFTLDIADKVMDNGAYAGHGMTAEDIMQQAANANVNVQKDFMVVMSSCVSGEDLQKMQEEGFTPGSTDVETYVTIVDEIKVKLAEAGVEVAGYNDNLDVEKIEQITGNRVDANALVNELSQALQESDMPVTQDNIEELVKAVMEGSSIETISEDAIKYMVVNQKAPTIENVYKAQYSSAGSIKQAQGYYSEGAGSYGKYLARKADTINWENLKGQLESVVKQAGLDTDKETKAQALENAKWLVASGIELNEKNLNLVTGLKNLSLPLGQKELVDMCVTAMENGKAPIKADMTGEANIAQQAREIAEEVKNISDEAVHDVVASGNELNLKNLSAAQKQIEEQQISQSASVSSTNEEITTKTIDQTVDAAALRETEAKRQLEEIRLMMSEEANRHLLKSGISIDTMKLSKLVEALKTAEENIKAALYKGNSPEENTQRAVLYEETLTKTKEIAGMPAAVLGKMASSPQSYTLLRIHEEGRELQEQAESQEQNAKQDAGQNPNQGQQKQAAATYETLMTAPRKDLGDKISKAFRNVDDILTDMNLETSEANRRAVRILGYNSMEITEKNINAVKQADSQVQSVISKMTPATTLQMIREQKNPLEMTMQELEAYLGSRETEPVQDAEKYSKFLQKLDRSHSISKDEREAYIGIYRMFRQIEKSDGAVIGSIVSTGAQMNFKNMLSAVRTNADKNMDVQIDDGFGALENLITKGKAIDEQISAGYQNQTNNEQEQYYARLSGEIKNELADRTDLEKLRDVNISEATTIEKFADDIKMTQLSENSPVQSQEKAENLKTFRQNMQEAEQIDEQVIETLIDYGQSISVDNIQAATMLLFDRGALFKQVMGQGKAIDGKTENTQAEGDNTTQDGGNTTQDSGNITQSSNMENAVLQQADSFVNNLSDSKQAGISYQEIISEANKAVETVIFSGNASHIDVKAAQALYKGLSLAGNLAREENYEVPMNIKGEITSVNLKIYHNASQTGKVAVTFDTEKLGRVAAEFDVTTNRVSGMVVYDNKQEKADLEQLEKNMKEGLSVDGQKQVQISLVHAKSVDLNKFGQDRVMDDESEKLSTVELYQTAKAFLTALKEF